MSTVSLYSELSNMRRTKVWNINWVHVVTTTFFRPSVAKVTAGQRWLATGDFLAGFVTNSFTPLKKKISIELNYFNIKSHHKKHPMVGHLPPLKQLDRRSNKDIATLLTEHVLHNNIATTCGAASWCCLSDFITATSPSLTNTSFHVTAPPQQPHTHTHTYKYCIAQATLIFFTLTKDITKGQQVLLCQHVSHSERWQKLYYRYSKNTDLAHVVEENK